MTLRLVIGAVVGGLLGFGVYRFIGCSSGTCPITSNPWSSTILGIIIGAMTLNGALAAPAARGGGNVPSSVVVLNDANFDAQVRTGVVLVDFWATWCGPCQRQGPIVEQVASQLKGKAVLGKLDVDAAQQTAQRLGIESIPTLVVFQNGTPVKRLVGLTGADELVAAVGAALAAQAQAGR
jgi:thioredoxin 1